MTIGADDSLLNRALSGIRGKLAGLAKTRFNLPGGGFAGMLGLTGVGLGIGGVVKTAADLESRMVMLAKATDLEGAALQAMKQQLMQLSTTVKGVRLNDLIDIATTGAKMGIATGDLIKYTEGIAKVSSAMDDIPAATIADQIGKLNTVFKLGVDGAMQFGSAIDKLADSGVSSASGILNVAQRIAGSAAVARLTAQETISLAAALLDTGTQAELASGALLDFIASLNQVKGRQTIAKTLGMDMAEFARLVEDKPMVAIQRFLAALAKMNAQGQIKTLEAMGMKGDVHPAEMMKLAQVAGTLDKYVGLANHEFKTLDQITKSYGASANTTNANLAVMQNHVQILADTLGTRLLPAINTGMGLINDLATGLADAFGRSAEVAKGWGIDLSGAIELASAGFRNLGDVFERTGVMLAGWAANVGEALSHAGEVVGTVASYLRESFVEAFQIVVIAATNAKDNLVTIFTEVWEYIKSGFKDPIEFKLKGLMEGIELKGDGKLKLPEFRGFSNVDPELDDIDRRMREREEERARKLADAAKKTPPPGAAPGQAAGGANAPDFGGGKKHNFVTDADAYARELQEGALKPNLDINKDILEQAKLQTELLRKIEKRNLDRQILAGFWG